MAIAPVSRSFPRADRGRSVSARHTLLELFDAALRAAHGRALVAAALRGKTLPAPIDVFAIGKAASAMALGARDALGERISRMLVITKLGHSDPGLAGDGIDQPRAFQGWLGLLQALDGLLGNTDEERSALPGRT